MIGMLFGVLEWSRQCNNNDYLLRTNSSCRGRLIVFPIEGGGKRMTFFIYFIHRGHPPYHFHRITLKVSLFTCSYLTFFGEGRSRRLLISSPLPPVHTTQKISNKGEGEMTPLLLDICSSFFVNYHLPPNPFNSLTSSSPLLLPPYGTSPSFSLEGLSIAWRRREKRDHNSQLNNSHKNIDIVTMSKK